MISIDELKNKLSGELFEHYKNIFSGSLINSILLGYKSKRITTFRINTIKAKRFEVIDLLKKKNLKFREINFLENGFYLDSNEKDLIKSDLFTDGKIYLQSISSMMPPLILKPLCNEKILDISAAPGSKTTQIAAMMDNKGIIDAVDPDHIRMERLKYNSNLLGVKIINFHKTNGEKFYQTRENYYDRVLADVPCSGEGIISVYDKKTIKNYTINNMYKLANLQYKLLKSAILSVKIGGIAVYSTCTLNCIENESVIDKILKDRDVKIDILPIESNFFNFEESIKPILKFGNLTFDNKIKNALRIIPSSRFEGFFICKIKKLG